MNLVAYPTITDADLREQRRKRGSVAVGIPMETWVGRSAFWRFANVFTQLRPNDRLLPIERQAVPGVIRNAIIRAFLDLPERFTHLFLFDSDMTIEHANIVDVFTLYDLPFVAGYCTRKTYPYLPVPAVHRGAKNFHGEQVHEYQPITNWEPKSGLRECDATGAAVLCLRRDLLAAIEPPWFAHEGGGEDYYFCRKVKAVTTLPDYPEGVPIMVDTYIKIGHVGESVAYPDTFFAVKEEYQRASGEREIELVSEAT